MSVTLWQGDCLEYMRGMGRGDVDFTFYDPPYNVGKDYGEYKDNLSPAEYKQWMTEVANRVRIVSRRGFAVFVCSDHNRLFYEILPDARLIPVIKYAEGITKDNITMQYFSLFVVGSPIIKCKDVWDSIRLPGEGYYFREERFPHPGQTAAALVKKVLYHFTEKYDIVFDPFCGVGTTAVVAEEMERVFTGCELNPVYVDIALKRIESTRAQMVMPL